MLRRSVKIVLDLLSCIRMDEIRKRLCENEDLLDAFCKEKGYKYSAGNKKKYFQELTHDGDLLHYIMTSMDAQDMKAFSDIVHGHDYKTCMDIINDYFTALNIDDYLDIQKLQPQETYSTYQIAALAQKYNIVIGMQYVERDGRQYVIIKSTLENQKSKQGYHDRWIEEGKTLCYFMQKENPDNIKKGFAFSHQPNRKIFDSIFHNASEPLDIYVFTRLSDGEPYIYQGVYHSIAVAEDGRAFTLANASISAYDPAISQPKAKFESWFLGKKPETIIHQKKPLSCSEPPSAHQIAAMAERAKSTIPAVISERDYIFEARLRQKIGDLGEEAVWEYEQEKIRKALPNDPEFAESLIKTMAWVSRAPGGEKYGYDIRSYNIINGQAVPIFIEVKTTTSDSTKEFYITQHELETARSEEINRNYYIYRVYNINSDQPMFYFMKGDPANFFKLKPFIWLAKVY